MDLAVGRWDPIGWPETSVRNYHYSLRNSPNERSSLVLCLFHHTSQVINIYQWFTCTLRYKYRGADKSLADLLPDVFCLMVRIFRLMLPRWTPLSKVRHPLPRWTPLSKVRHPLPRWTPLSKVRPPLPRWTPLIRCDIHCLDGHPSVKCDIHCPDGHPSVRCDIRSPHFMTLITT